MLPTAALPSTVRRRCGAHWCGMSRDYRSGAKRDTCRYRAVSGCWLGLARRDGRNWILDCSIPLAKPVRVTATKVAARDVAAERSRRSRPTPEAVTARVLQAAS